jgi:hypothetical protein
MTFRLQRLRLETLECLVRMLIGDTYFCSSSIRSRNFHAQRPPNRPWPSCSIK